MSNQELVRQVLKFLQVDREEVSLPFLNKLIKSHQLKVKWETFTKVVDREKGHKSGNYLPSVDVYFDRVINRGMGGTCWTHAVGFHWLLQHLGLDVYYVYMDSRHLCLRVDLDQPYYVDVGYCAPLFKAYPMFESFQVSNEREKFEYIVENDLITVVRSPGPTKTLNTNPVAIDDMQSHIERSNNWDVSPVLREMQVFGYIDGVPTSIKGNIVKQHFEHGKVEHELSNDEVEQWVTERFGMDKEIFNEAINIYKRKMGM